MLTLISMKQIQAKHKDITWDSGFFHQNRKVNLLISRQDKEFSQINKIYKNFYKFKKSSTVSCSIILSFNKL